MTEAITVIGTLAGVILGFVLSLVHQHRIEKRKRKEVACSFKTELELNVKLIRAIQKELNHFKGPNSKIVQEIHQFKVYNNLFSWLPSLGYDLLTQIKSFYDLLNIKYKQSTMGSLDMYSSIGTDLYCGCFIFSSLVD